MKDLEISVAARSGARRAGDLASSRFADDIDAEYRLANLFRTKRHIEEMIQENANIIEKMYHEASRIFDGKGAPDGRDGDYVYSQVLLISRVILPGSVTVPDDAAPCSWERAIHAAEAPILALRTTEAVPGRSGSRAGERESSAGPALSEIAPAPADSDAAAARQPLSPAERAEDFVTDLENLKLLAKVADDLIASYRRDVVDYDGDVKALGTTFGRTGRDPRDQVLAKLWSVIYRDAPSRNARFRSVMQAMKFMTDREESGG